MTAQKNFHVRVDDRRSKLGNCGKYGANEVKKKRIFG
jgi:hypothetical protein